MQVKEAFIRSIHIIRQTGKHRAWIIFLLNCSWVFTLEDWMWSARQKGVEAHAVLAEGAVF